MFDRALNVLSVLAVYLMAVPDILRLDKLINQQNKYIRSATNSLP